jgi:type 1 fimbria pilin
MKILAALTFILGIFVAPIYAQAKQQGTVSFNGNIFDAPQWPDAGYTQPPPAKAKTPHHVKRHVSHKNSAS